MTVASPNFTLSDYREAHEQLFAFYNDLTGRLTDEQMEVPSLCPGWNLRDVIAHGIGIETVLTGWAPSTETAPPFERMGELGEAAETMSRSEFAIRVQEITSSRMADLDRLDPAVVDVPSVTPAGLATYGRFLQVRVFDLWVHARDIAIPLGETLDDSGFGAEMSLTEVDTAIGYIVGKKIGLPEGKSIVFDIRGPVEREIAVSVDGRATRVESVENPDVVVRTDVGTFVMLAAGRLDPQAQLDNGKVTLAGDPEWADRAAKNLAYTG